MYLITTQVSQLLVLRSLRKFPMNPLSVSFDPEVNELRRLMRIQLRDRIAQPAFGIRRSASAQGILDPRRPSLLLGGLVLESLQNRNLVLCLVVERPNPPMVHEEIAAIEVRATGGSINSRGAVGVRGIGPSNRVEVANQSASAAALRRTGEMMRLAIRRNPTKTAR